MQKLRKMFSKILRTPKKLIDRKHYFEFIAAILSIPVLITVFLLNVNSLKTMGKSSVTPTPEIKPEKVYITVPVNNTGGLNSDIKVIPTSGQCVAEVGAIDIDSPTEGEVVMDNPVNIIVDYQAGKYCDAVWSYRINGGDWSDYDDKSIALYNIPQGDVRLDLRAKSIVSGDEKDLTRNFVYKGKAVSTPTPSPDFEGSGEGTSSAK